MQNIPHAPSTNTLAIAGVHVESDGYPNVKIRLRALRQITSGKPTEIAFPFRGRGFERNQNASFWLLRMTAAFFRLLFAHAWVLAKLMTTRLSSTCIYIPYPAVFVLYGIGLFPRRLRPKTLIADAFISFYDTVVTDRGLLSPNSVLARILRRMEARAYAHAKLVVVDTDLSADYFSKTFHVPRDRLLTVPLSIDEEVYRHVPYKPHPNRVRVLFVGTFVPLQGVETIARAMTSLRDQHNIEFVLIGDGQTGAAVAELLSREDYSNINWIRKWQNPVTIAQYVAAADICLGIFGNSDKADRVWPLKNYTYMAVGRSVITADTSCARGMTAIAQSAPFVTTAPGDPVALAAAILELAHDAHARAAYAAAGRTFYEHHLSNEIGTKRLSESIRAMTTANL